MNVEAQQILQYLREVSAERAARAADSALAARVVAIKAFQHARFMQTYADLLAGGRYAGAARFFLDDLYGPRDFTERDDQFARVIPGMAKLFSKEISHTVLALAELHALSERMDTAMGRAHAVMGVDGASYGRAWRSVGQAAVRERQIVLMLSVGQALDGYTRSALLRHSLRLLRGPAHAAGLGALQEFLERGFDTFREMGGADAFLTLVAERERDLAARLFDGEAAPELAPA